METGCIVVTDFAPGAPAAAAHGLLGKAPHAGLGTTTTHCLAPLEMPVADEKLEGTSAPAFAQCCTGQSCLCSVPLTGGSWEAAVEGVGVKNHCLL